MAGSWHTKACTTDMELQQILQLQQLNLPAQKTVEELSAQGFVTVQHSFEELKQMNAEGPHAIAVDNNVVVGYALVMTKSFRDLIPVLQPMFAQFDETMFNGKPLNQYDYYACGQVCVAEGYRGKGVFAELYQQQKRMLKERFQLCVTEVAERNIRSVNAHLKIGFKALGAYTDATDKWLIVGWPF